MTTLETQPLRRLAVVVAAWLGASLFGLGVAATTKIGPILLSVSDNHGVHLGDLVAFGAGYLMALVVTATVLGSRVPSHW